MDANKKEREAWEIDDLELLRQQAADNGSLAAKQAYINGLEYELRASLAQPARCRVCYGNDADAPCAYTTERPNGCLRAARLSQLPADTIALPVAEYEAMKRDAERYRSVREGIDNGPEWIRIVGSMSGAGSISLRHEYADQFIDRCVAAVKAREHQ